MLLAIDAGNTNVTFALFQGDRLRAEWRMATDARRTADEYAVWLLNLMRLEGIEASSIKDAVIATVVPQTLFDLRTLCRRYFNCRPLVVGDGQCELGIQVLVERPQDVGADRLVDAVAAGLSWKGPLIVIDFGTATTFDVVNKDGNYCGGVIAPGVNLNLEALHMAAAKLPRIAVGRPDHVVGGDTVQAMKSGVYWGYIALIEGLVRRIEAERGETMTVIATGGLAPLFADATPSIHHVAPDLMMRGLLAIYKRNRTLPL